MAELTEIDALIGRLQGIYQLEDQGCPDELVSYMIEEALRHYAFYLDAIHQNAPRDKLQSVLNNLVDGRK